MKTLGGFQVPQGEVEGWAVTAMDSDTEQNTLQIHSI